MGCRVAVGALAGLVLAGGGAGANLVVQPSPPVSSELPTHAEEQRAQEQVVDGAQSLEQQQRTETPLVMEGKITRADPDTNELELQGRQGPVLFQLPQDAKVQVDGRPVGDLSELQEGSEVRASYDATGDQVHLELHPVAPAQDEPVQPDGHSIEHRER